MSSFLDRLHVEVSGPEGAPPLLILHGWGSSAELMRPAAAGLEGSFRIHNIDLPGHGKTPPPPEPWGVPEFAAVVDAYLRRLDVGPVPVIAHSNGGRISLFMASDERYRHHFQKLLLIAPSGVKASRPPQYYIKTAWIKTLKAPFAVLPMPLRERGLAWLRTTIYWQLAASSDYQQASAAMRGTFVRTVTHHLDDRLDRIDVPVLIMRGDRDDAISHEQVERMKEAIPDAGLVEIDGAGHYAYLDDPATYQAVAAHFLGIHQQQAA